MKTRIDPSALVLLGLLLTALTVGVQASFALCDASSPADSTVQFTIPIRIADHGTQFDTLWLGVHPDATFCTDALLGETELPPEPPEGIFETRFLPPYDTPIECFGQGLKLDVRPYVNPAQVDTYKVHFDAGSGGYPMTLSWPNMNAYYTGAVRLKDALTGTIINIDMKAASSYIVTSTIHRNVMIEATGPYNQTVSGVPAPRDPSVPEHYALRQNYPNPFNPTTTIGFDLSASGRVSLKVYNVLGVESANVFETTVGAGRYEVTWDASHLPSGIYFYRLQAGNYSQMKKMILMK